MNLSDRLKNAEYDRRLAAGLPVDHLSSPAEREAQNVKVDVRRNGSPFIDLTDGPYAEVIPLGDNSARATNPATAEPATTPAPTGPEVGQRSQLECPQCGGPTQVDLVDAVGHTVSLSCLSCFHMFRVEA